MKMMMMNFVYSQCTKNEHLTIFNYNSVKEKCQGNKKNFKAKKLRDARKFHNGLTLLLEAGEGRLQRDA